MAQASERPSSAQRSANGGTPIVQQPQIPMPQLVVAGAEKPLSSPAQQPQPTANPLSDVAARLDRSLRYLTSRVTLALSPAAIANAYFDWLIHIASAPGKRLELQAAAVQAWQRLASYIISCMRPGTEGRPCPCIEPLPYDKRFRNEAWCRWPFDIIYQSFLLQEDWWRQATMNVYGVSHKHEQLLTFAARQLLDVWSPANFIATNPEVLQKTFHDGGTNLARGFLNFAEDWQRAASGEPPVGTDAFKLGKNVAVTRGKVIYRNRLIELIQYEPTTAAVHPEPVLIAPAWIMKYYILDLTPHRSLVRFLVNQGFTVFLISWKNPEQDDRDLSMEDYRALGVGAALDAVREIVPNQQIHGVGYCLGGTLLAIAAAALARDDAGVFKTLSFLAAQIDFEEAGELTLFINDSQVAFLEDVMREQGYLDARQMAGAFQLLHSNDLIWSYVIHDYLMGERAPAFDLMAWNADATRMPARMHSEYLRQLFLNNDLAEGRYKADGRAVALTDIRAPVFAVGTETDHVAPWRSVYKLNLYMDTTVTFLLTSGGHNAGIVSEPGHPGRIYRMREKREQDHYLDPESWLRETTPRKGSWWLEWASWLASNSHAPVSPPGMGAPARGLRPLCDAPGTYVLQR